MYLSVLCVRCCSQLTKWIKAKQPPGKAKRGGKGKKKVRRWKPATHQTLGCFWLEPSIWFFDDNVSRAHLLKSPETLGKRRHKFRYVCCVTWLGPATTWCLLCTNIHSTEIKPQKSRPQKHQHCHCSLRQEEEESSTKQHFKEKGRSQKSQQQKFKLN